MCYALIMSSQCVSVQKQTTEAQYLITPWWHRPEYTNTHTHVETYSHPENPKEWIITTMALHKFTTGYIWSSSRNIFSLWNWNTHALRTIFFYFIQPFLCYTFVGTDGCRLPLHRTASLHSNPFIIQASHLAAAFQQNKKYDVKICNDMT